MLRRNVLTKTTPILAAALVFFSTTTVVLAATKPTSTSAPQVATGAGNALRISPVRQDLTIKPGASQVVDVYVQNLTAKAATLQAIVNDFTANNDESGTPNILLNPNSYAPSHGLKRYVSPIPNVTLQPNEQKDVKVTITIPANAGGGGYFGAVRFAPVASDNGANVSLSASVGSLILVTVPGNITEQLSVAGFGVTQVKAKQDTTTSQPKLGRFFTSRTGLQAIARFRNTGNVQVAPFGKIILKKGSQTLATYELNNTSPRGNVLPDSIRRFEIPLTALGSLGKYTLQGNFGYGTKGQLLTASQTFYIVPVPFIVGAILVVLLILFLIFVLPRAIRAYNRRIINRANKASRK